VNPRPLNLNVPPGARDGAIIRVPWQSAGEINHHSKGDLFIKLKITPHPVFKADGDDVNIRVQITPWEAVLGATIEVPTLDGAVALAVPTGVQSGKRLRLKGRGLNKRDGERGDAFVQFVIVAPSDPSDQEMDLYKQLSRLDKSNPRGK
jgi:DnaJ-class molecular chaperone